MAFEYPEKLSFRCIRCGICCGDTQERTRHVLLLQEEAEEIALTVKKEISTFASEVNDKTPYSHEMKKGSKDGKCVFLKENHCVVYSKRPLICRFYPFGLETSQDNQKSVYFTNECPGIGRGKIMGEDKFRKLLNEANKRIVMRKPESSQ